MYFLALTISTTMLACAPRGSRPVEQPQQTASKEIRLVDQLPADTTFYGQVDMAGLLAQYRASSEFVDPELTRRMADQAQHMLDALVQIAAERGFKPLLAKRIHKTKLHFVGLTTASTSTKNQLDADGESEQSFTFLIECSPKQAKDFIDQLKAYMHREFEKQAGNTGLWTILDTDSGEMIRFHEMQEFVVGWFDKYIVLSNKIPQRLFTAIQSGEEPSNFAENERFARFCQSGSPVYFAANMQELVKELEDSLRQSQPEQAQVLLDLLGLGDLRSAGFLLDLKQTDETSTYRAIMSLQHGQILAPLLQQLLRGGQEFRLPRGAQDADLAVMWRLGLPEIYKQVVQKLPPNAQQQHQMVSAMVSSATGYSLAALLDLLTGDFYWFNKMNQQTAADNKRAKSSKEALEIMFSGWNAVFVGIRDQAATKQALDKIFEALGSMSMTAEMMSTRTFQGQQIYLVGQGENVEHDHIGIVIDRNTVGHIKLEFTNRLDSQNSKQSGAERNHSNRPEQTAPSQFVDHFQ